MAVDLDLEHWNRAAEGYDAYIEKGDLLRTLLNTSLLALCGNIKDTHILDAGCGQGRFSHLLHSQGAHVMGIDGSEALIRIAKKRYEKEGIQFSTHNLKENLPFPPNSFGLVVANMVLMDIDPLTTTIREFSRTLKPHGILTCAILHPFFANGNLHKTLLDKIWRTVPYYLIRHYHTAGKKQWQIFGTTNKTTVYHRPLEYYAELLHQNGFTIELLQEPCLKPEEVKNENNFLKICAEIPPFLLIRAKKIN